jgi:hypothetical protein
MMDIVVLLLYANCDYRGIGWSLCRRLSRGQGSIKGARRILRGRRWRFGSTDLGCEWYAFKSRHLVIANTSIQLNFDSGKFKDNVGARHICACCQAQCNR